MAGGRYKKGTIAPTRRLILESFCTLVTSFSHSSKGFCLDMGLSLESLESWLEALPALEAFLDLSILTWRKFRVVMKEISPVFESPAEF